MELMNTYQPIDTESKFDHQNFAESYSTTIGLGETLEKIVKNPADSKALATAGKSIWNTKNFYEKLKDGSSVAEKDLGYWANIGMKNIDKYTIKNARDMYNVLGEYQEQFTLSSKVLKIEKSEEKADSNNIYNAFAEAANNLRDAIMVSEIKDNKDKYGSQVDFITKKSKMSKEWNEFMKSRMDNDSYTALVFGEFQKQANFDYRNIISDENGNVDMKKYTTFMDTNFNLQLMNPTKEFGNTLQAFTFNSYLKAEKAKEETKKQEKEANAAPMNIAA